MKKTITAAFLLVIVMSGCDFQYPSEIEQPIREIHQTLVVDFKEISIDSCQYLIIYNDNNIGQSVTHKGNCNNPIHKTK